MKTMTVTVNYGTWAVSEEDAIRLLGIARRMRRVKQRYPEPPIFDDASDPFLDSASIAEVVEPEPTDFTAVQEAAPVPAATSDEIQF